MPLLVVIAKALFVVVLFAVPAALCAAGYHDAQRRQRARRPLPQPQPQMQAAPERVRAGRAARAST